MGFLFPNLPIPDAPLAAGGFADRITAIMANRKKIDDEREFRRQQAERLNQLSDLTKQASDEGYKSVVESKLAALPEDQREQSRSALESNPNAVVWNGKVYPNRAAAEQANREENQLAVAREYEKSQGSDYDAKVREFQLKQQQAEAGRLKAMQDYGINASDPDSQAKLDNIYADKIAKAQAELDAAKVQHLDPKTGKPRTKTGAQKLDELNRSIQGILDEKDMHSGQSSSIYQKAKDYQRGISDQTKDLLEMQLINNPLPAPEDYRIRSRAVADAVERRMPDIIKLQAYLPDQTKAVLENLLKGNEKQGDKASDNEIKTYLANQGILHADMRSAASASAAAANNANAYALKALKMAQEGKFQDAKIALGYADLNQKYWKTNQDNLARKENALIGAGSRVQAAQLTTGAGYSPEGRAQVDEMLNPYNVARSAVMQALSSGRLLKADKLFQGGAVGMPAPENLQTTQDVTIKSGVPIFGSDESKRTSSNITTTGSYLDEWNKAHPEAAAPAKGAKASKVSKGDVTRATPPMPKEDPGAGRVWKYVDGLGWTKSIKRN